MVAMIVLMVVSAMGGLTLKIDRDLEGDLTGFFLPVISHISCLEYRRQFGELHEAPKGIFTH